MRFIRTLGCVFICGVTASAIDCGTFMVYGRIPRTTSVPLQMGTKDESGDAINLIDIGESGPGWLDGHFIDRPLGSSESKNNQEY